MTLEQLLQAYGYPVILLGTFLEGETVLVLAGLLAHLGYLSLPFVMTSAFFGAWAGDQFFFHIGRWRGIDFLQRRPSLIARVERVRRLLARREVPLMLAGRFLFGLRTVLPLVLGAVSHIRPLRYAGWDGLSALLWAMAIGSAGYLFGSVMELVVKDLRVAQHWVILALIVAGALAWARALHARRVSPNGSPQP